MIRTVRSRGYLLEQGRPQPATGPDLVGRQHRPGWDSSAAGPPSSSRMTGRTRSASPMVRVVGRPPEERARLRGLMIRLLAEKRWEAAEVRVTEEMRLVIAAQAALLVLGSTSTATRTWATIIVHPSTLVLHGERASAR